QKKRLLKLSIEKQKVLLILWKKYGRLVVEFDEESAKFDPDIKTSFELIKEIEKIIPIKKYNLLTDKYAEITAEMK
ncbi:MAG: hypothetical protein Q7K42_00860, partial [Candidatus Diapherotrites archaeon]|nr:hypothetical protein [Candidatus Diapherotrites archaeon]